MDNFTATEDYDDFDALLEASSLGTPRVLAALGTATPDARRRFDQAARHPQTCSEEPGTTPRHDGEALPQTASLAENAAHREPQEMTEQRNIEVRYLATGSGKSATIASFLRHLQSAGESVDNDIVCHPTLYFLTPHSQEDLFARLRTPYERDEGTNPWSPQATAYLKTLLARQAGTAPADTLRPRHENASTHHRPNPYPRNALPRAIDYETVRQELAPRMICDCTDDLKRTAGREHQAHSFTRVRQNTLDAILHNGWECKEPSCRATSRSPFAGEHLSYTQWQAFAAGPFRLFQGAGLSEPLSRHRPFPFSSWDNLPWERVTCLRLMEDPCVLRARIAVWLQHAHRQLVSLLQYQQSWSAVSKQLLRWYMQQAALADEGLSLLVGGDVAATGRAFSNTRPSPSLHVLCLSNAGSLPSQGIACLPTCGGHNRADKTGIRPWQLQPEADTNEREHLGELTVQTEIAGKLHLAGKGDSTLPLATSLFYRAADPYAVEAVFTLNGRPVRWMFARDLLVEGMHGRTGVGDIAVWSNSDSEGAHTFIELSPPSGTALVSLPHSRVEEFLNQSTAIAQKGAEYTLADSSLHDLEAQLNQCSTLPGGWG
ncbi:hypothetical protein GCM10010211_82480 [Streptomyces albospinus]|uniref:SsgA family sporulation/cell division regulator n=1 Tax=Streptomyces albospinus TaxID=285515 RepID=A0ABQ2VNV8_9ACTN|nr:SsgA family sporulation/cell division regulator [Streptomyces albospinus]GGV02679.1 hypothetical protein GCM10010211_82480 [Streptomyces albospinus]